MFHRFNSTNNFNDFIISREGEKPVETTTNDEEMFVKSQMIQRLRPAHLFDIKCDSMTYTFMPSPPDTWSHSVCKSHTFYLHFSGLFVCLFSLLAPIHGFCEFAGSLCLRWAIKETVLSVVNEWESTIKKKLMNGVVNDTKSKSLVDQERLKRD